ncbi:MAG: hypothetical protein ACPHN2_08850 [Sinimarinibacterium flocculans]|uniref:hypothetical protein n=1 Tax=Sinimarinibacterium flocculans TaxID=985250 RepID=UPI003C428C8E
MSAPTFRGMPLAKGLQISIRPRGWGLDDRPSATVFDGNNPVATFYLRSNRGVDGWLSTWGISGPEVASAAYAADLCELMGWQMPGQMRAAE